jgi:hypothetical protein
LRSIFIRRSPISQFQAYAPDLIEKFAGSTDIVRID